MAYGWLNPERFLQNCIMHKIYLEFKFVTNFAITGALQLQKAFRWVTEPLAHGPLIIEPLQSLRDSDLELDAAESSKG